MGGHDRCISNGFVMLYGIMRRSPRRRDKVKYYPRQSNGHLQGRRTDAQTASLRFYTTFGSFNAQLRD